MVRVARLVLLGVVALVGCDKAKGKQMSEPSSDQEILTRFIKVPGKPSEVRWQTLKNRPGDNWSLVAVLSYAPDALREIVARMPKVNGHPNVPQQFLSWLPQPIQQKYRSAPESPPGFVPVEATTLAPEPFLGVTGCPLTHGRVIAFESEGALFLITSTQ